MSAQGASTRAQPPVVEKAIKSLDKAWMALKEVKDKYSKALPPEFLEDLQTAYQNLQGFSDAIAQFDFNEIEKKRGKK